MKTLIFIPTYNESENIEKIYNELVELRLNTDILFLDDNSPDGTGKIIDKLVKNSSTTYVIHRSGKLGIGSAHLDGINWALNNHYEMLITMDCDFTHSPSYIIDFINNSTNYDIVIGSRYMQKKSLSSWNLFRKSLTLFGHLLTSVLLGMPYDASGAFRLYRLDKINKGIFDLVVSKGYSFFFESLFILHLNNCSIKEIPIHLPARTYGHSKMTIKDMWKSLTYLLSMSIRNLFNKKYLIYKTATKTRRH